VMKPSFLFVAAIAATLILFCSAFNLRKSVHPDAVSAIRAAAASRTATASHAVAAVPTATAATIRQNTHYYWFLSGDVYDGFNTIPVEISRMEDLFGVTCDTNPTGGTLVAKGYVMPFVPHLFFPSAFIYSH
ncbi:MAG TPA: hypothetical protein VI233_18060, partial [Puia sp.]